MSCPRISRIPVLSLVVALGGTASFFACASGDDSFGLGSVPPVSTQSQGDDGGTLFEAGANDDALTLPSPSSPTGNDAATPTTSDDAGSTSDDSGSMGTDSASPPPVDAAPPPPVDSGTTTTCAGYAPPSTPAGCTCDPTKHSCTPNGCYNGYYCKLSTLGCYSKPSGC